MAAITLQIWMHSSKYALNLVAGGQIFVSSTMQTMHPLLSAKQRHRAANLQARRSQLQAIFGDINVAKAIAKDPLLLKYTPVKLKQDMDQLKALLGQDEASAMVARMPALLHYRTSTLSHKLDDLYDLLPDADIGKVQQNYNALVYQLQLLSI